MKSRVVSAAAVFSLAASGIAAAPARAQEQPAVHQVSYNVAITSDYRYRGLSQTRLDPALQGGVDYVHAPTGLYVGTWLSTIKWTRDLGGDGQVEWDVYGGKRGEFASGVTWDVGGLYYFYPDNSLNPDADTFELYGRLGYGPAYIKYSHATTNLFGTANSENSGYLDIGADVNLPRGFVLNLHAGRQRVRNNSDFSYNDYKVGVTKDIGGAYLSLAWIKADTSAYLSPQGENLGKSAAVITVSKTF